MREIVFIETHVQRLKDGKIIENVSRATNLEFEMLLAPGLTPNKTTIGADSIGEIKLSCPLIITAV